MTFANFTSNQILLLLSGFALLLGSVILFKTNKGKSSIYLLFTGTFVMGLFMASLDHFLMLWDEQFHALVAKNMLHNPLKPVLYNNPILDYDYKNWTANHIWLHKQPLFLWQMALSMKIFGINELSVRLPSIFCHAITTLFLYRVGKLSISQSAGFYGALFFAVAYYPMEMVAGKYATDHNDVSFLFYVMGSFWAWFEYTYSKNAKYLMLIGVFAGGAVLVKWLFGLLIFPVWFLTIGAEYPKQWLRPKAYLPVLKSFLIAICVFIPWQIYIWLQFPAEARNEFLYNNLHLYQSVENHNGDFWFHFKALKELYVSYAILPLYAIGFILMISRAVSNKFRIAILAAVIITYLFYSFAATKMLSYGMVVSPFIFLGLGCLFTYVLRLIYRYRISNYLNIALSTVSAIFISVYLMHLPKIRINHTDYNLVENSTRKSDLETMYLISNLKSKLKNEKYVVFNVKPRPYSYIPVMFYTNYVAYENTPSQAQIEKIRKTDYKMAILVSGSLPDYIMTDKDIFKVDSK